MGHSLSAPLHHSRDVKKMLFYKLSMRVKWVVYMERKRDGGGLVCWLTATSVSAPHRATHHLLALLSHESDCSPKPQEDTKL